MFVLPTDILNFIGNFMNKICH